MSTLVLTYLTWSLCKVNVLAIVGSYFNHGRKRLSNWHFDY